MLLLFAATSSSGDAFGVWKLNPARSTPGGHQNIVTLRIAPHIRGEAFTSDSVSSDGHASTSSTILYLDGKARAFQDDGCSGTQASRRLDSQTVEILRECAGGQIRLLRRAVDPGVLILEITEQKTGGRRTKWRLVMEKQ